MGLDVTLYRYATVPTENADGDYEPEGEQIEIDSKVHPGHMFKIGYLRSSYNDGGIDRILTKYIGQDLGTIFGGPPPDAHVFRPDWGVSLRRLRQAKSEYEAHLASAQGHSVMAFDFNPFVPPADLIPSERAALDAFLKTKAYEDAKPAAERESGGWYGNRLGDFFFGKRLVVRAVFPGWRKNFRGITEPCFFVVVEGEPTTEPDWYLQALEITGEMIEWVLGQADADRYYLHWSA